MSSNRPVLVDADILIYYTAFASQKMRYFYEGVEYADHETLRAYLAKQDLKPKDVDYEKRLEVYEDDVFYIVAAKAEEMIAEMCGSNNLELYVSGPSEDNFRNEVATIKKYKGNRTAPKPEKFELAREYYLSKATAVSAGEEADDLLAIRQAELNYEGIIASIDKDLNQIPGRHFNWDKEARYIVTPEDGDWFFWYQMLTGDRADNIPGIPRHGDKTAKKVLDGLDKNERVEAVIEKYKKTYGESWEDAMTEVGRLLWMRRQPEQMWTLERHKDYSELDYHE